jgi:hypothetical protein
LLLPDCLCDLKLIGDGVCSRECYNNECGWDQQDCQVRISPFSPLAQSALLFVDLFVDANCNDPRPYELNLLTSHADLCSNCWDKCQQHYEDTEGRFPRTMNPNHDHAFIRSIVNKHEYHALRVRGSQKVVVVADECVGFHHYYNDVRFLSAQSSTKVLADGCHVFDQHFAALIVCGAKVSPQVFQDRVDALCATFSPAPSQQLSSRLTYNPTSKGIDPETQSPSNTPSYAPSSKPTVTPTAALTYAPIPAGATTVPTIPASRYPTFMPTSLPTVHPTAPIGSHVPSPRSCAPGCWIGMIGDGICDELCMNPACYFDRGDCESILGTPAPDWKVLIETINAATSEPAPIWTPLPSSLPTRNPDPPVLYSRPQVHCPQSPDGFTCWGRGDCDTLTGRCLCNFAALDEVCMCPVGINGIICSGLGVCDRSARTPSGGTR